MRWHLYLILNIFRDSIAFPSNIFLFVVPNTFSPLKTSNGL